MWTDSIEVLNPSEGVVQSAGMKLCCTKDGCRFAMAGSPMCSGCGFELHEYARRRALPLVLGADGLRRKIVRGARAPMPSQLRVKIERSTEGVGASAE